MGRFPDVLEIEDISLPIVLERSKRKTLTIQITRELQLMVKAPLNMQEREIFRFMQQKQFWIYKQAKRMIEASKTCITRSEEEVRQLRNEARALLTKKTEEYANQIGVSYQKIRIGNPKTRWGSCSNKGTISYNWHLVLLPERIVDYVVVHELCHILEMNHSKRFWEHVADVLPDYAERRKWLKEHGNEYMM